ncbi:MAG TPA: methyltransferase domain-containing protein [Thermoanaerobaculia bacterium]|jgi:SAM-dependent methyltransferase|nr:methyltransferase domain-containing protein [Thermoanaerobaculia bacterium]
MKHARTTPEVAVDWTKCFGYETLISEEIEHYSEIEVTEDLKEGGIAANRAWFRWYEFLAALWQTDFIAEIVETARRFEAPRLLSLGCGYAGMELACARQLSGPYEMLALDVNENLFRRAREEVARDGLHVELQAVDLNYVVFEESAFDVVFAHASLHHLLNFEHLFGQVHQALRNGGRLIVLDIIGKTQVLFWPENVRFATDLVAKMPERYRRGLEADARTLFPGYIDGAAQEGMEGIRQEELEEQIGRYFHPLKMHKYNSFVRLLCTHPTIALSFDLNRAEDQEYLDSLFRLDLEQIASGGLRATEMFAVYEKKPRDLVLSADLGGWTAPQDHSRVSVCLLVEESIESLRTCFASLLAQTHRNLEIFLLLSDESREDVAELTRQLATSHPVRLIVSASSKEMWRRALAEATGEYVACLSSQDAWYPIKLSEQLAFMEQRPALGFGYAQAIVVDDRGRRTARVFGKDVVGDDISGTALESLIDGYEIPRSTAIFRRSCWLEVAPQEADVTTEDDLWLRLAARFEVGFQDRPLGMLRAPIMVSPESYEPRRQRHRETLARFREDAGLLDSQLGEPEIRRGCVADRNPEPPAGPGLLRRMARLLIGRRA